MLGERHHLLKSSYRAWSHGGNPKSLVDLVREPALYSPESTALCLIHHDSHPEPVSRGELWREALGAAAILAESGLEKDDRVLLVLPTGREFPAFFFGTLIAGGIPVPAAPPPILRGPALAAHQQLLVTLAEDCRPSRIVATQELLAAVQPVVTAIPDCRSLKAVISPRDDQPHKWWRRPGDIALLQYTSGSTSAPKGVQLSHRNLLSNMRAITNLTVSEDTVGVSWLPLFHDMGLIGCLLSALLGQAPLVLMPPRAFVKDPARWLRAISDFRATATVAPNFAYDYCFQSVAAEDISDVQLDSLAIALNGSEVIDAESVRRFESAYRVLGLRPGTVRAVYGLAESALAVTFSKPGPVKAEWLDAEAAERDGVARAAVDGERSVRVVCVGSALPGHEIAIADPETAGRLPERHIGEVLVRGPSVMQGYFNSPEESARTVRNGWLHTGDLGFLAAGELYLTGRIKDVIIRHGRNYYPADLECQISRLEGIRETGVAVIGVEGNGSCRVAALAETRLQAEPELRALVGKISRCMHDAFNFGPDEVILLRHGALPRTTSGKIRRVELMRTLRNGNGSEAEDFRSRIRFQWTPLSQRGGGN